MKKPIVIIVAVIVVAGLGYFVLSKDDSGKNPAVPSSGEPPVSESNSPTSIPTATPTPTSMPAVHNVTIQNFSFNQSSITVKKGDTVVWINKDSAPHTVTGNNGGPSSPTISTNGTYRFTFDSVGTFGYHCTFHPSMKGTVVVTQ